MPRSSVYRRSVRPRRVSKDICESTPLTQPYHDDRIHANDTPYTIRMLGRRPSPRSSTRPPKCCCDEVGCYPVLQALVRPLNYALTPVDVEPNFI